MAKPILNSKNVRQASSAYTELFNDKGLSVFAMKSGRFEVICGATKTVAHSLTEIQEKVNSLDLHTYAGSGEEVVASIQKKLGSQYKLEIVAGNDIVHTVEGSRKHINDNITCSSLDVQAMIPGNRYAMQDNMFGGDFAMLVPQNGQMVEELSPSFEINLDPQMYEQQPYAKGMVVHGIDPATQDITTCVVDTTFPNGTFKDFDGKIWSTDDIDLFQLVVGDASPVIEDDYQEPDVSLYESDNIPTYNPVGEAQELAPNLYDLENYDMILNASAGVLSDFMKTANKVAYLDRSSLNKVTISSVNKEGQATDGLIEWNVRIGSPLYKRTSLITIPLVMKQGSIDLATHFTVSTGQEMPMTIASIQDHLGTLASDNEMFTYSSKDMNHTFASTIHVSEDVDALLDGIESVSEEVEASEEEETIEGLEESDMLAVVTEEGETVPVDEISIKLNPQDNLVDVEIETSTETEEVEAVETEEEQDSLEAEGSKKTANDNLAEAKKLWAELEDIPVTEDGEELEQDWHIFEKGVEVTEIWHWFEETYNLSVAEDLMGLSKENKKTASKNASKKTAGGGAGIRFENIILDNPIKGEILNGKLTIIDKGSIKSFDAVGYEDGLRDVRGDILDISSVTIEVQDVLDVLGLDSYNPSELLEFRIDSLDDFTDVLFGGYVRGTVKQGDVVVSCDEALGDGVADTETDSSSLNAIAVDIQLSATLEFADFYKDIFDINYADDDVVLKYIKEMQQATEDDTLYMEDDQPQLDNARTAMDEETIDYNNDNWKVASKKTASTVESMDSILNDYLVAALWASTISGADDSEREGTSFDEDYTVDDFSPEAVRIAKKVIEDFMSKATPLIEASDVEMESIGHDLWLTRNGHGAGFWARDYGELGDQLTELAEKYYSVYLFPSESLEEGKSGQVEMDDEWEVGNLVAEQETTASKKVANVQVGDMIQIISENENYEDFLEGTYEVDSVSYNTDEHPGYDYGVGGDALIDAKGLPFSLYEYEFEIV